MVFAALMLVPMGLKILGQQVGWWYWPVVAGFAVSYILGPSPLAAVLAVPYLLMATVIMLLRVAKLFVSRQYSLTSLVAVVVLLYWVTGAVWAVFYMGDVHPFDFDATIVGLTAAHFHVAGFVIGVVALQIGTFHPNRFSRALLWAVLLGMPLVAAGIVLTKCGYNPAFEWITGTLFAGLGMVVAGWQINTFTQKQYPLPARRYWAVGGACLFIGACMAFLYALRFYAPLSWITIPNMKIWHGTLNGIGFGWLSLRGWLANSRSLSEF